MCAKKKILIIAGEASGDSIGAKLIQQLIASRGNSIEFQGVGGSNMMAVGLNSSVFPMSDISLIGFAEIISKIPKIILRLNQLLKFTKQYVPDLIVTIDSPGFNFRFVEKIRKILGSKIPIVHYVAPTVWAYKPERAQKVVRLYNFLLTILPFEKPYFDAVNLPCEYVGHPIVEDKPHHCGLEGLRNQHNLPKAKRLITIAPGSRMGEIKKHMPIICETIKELISWNKNLIFIIPTLENLRDLLEEYCRKMDVIECVRVITEQKERDELVYLSDAALVKSGTIALELAKFGIPMIIAYKLSPITAFFLKKKLTIKYVSIVNLILDKPIIPELLQENFIARNVVIELKKLLEPNNKNKKEQQKAFKEVLEMLGGNDEITPSEKAAKKILEYI